MHDRIKRLRKFADRVHPGIHVNHAALWCGKSEKPPSIVTAVARTILETAGAFFNLFDMQFQLPLLSPYLRAIGQFRYSTTPVSLN